MEWLYAFDIHCNSFFPFFIILYVIQYFFIPLLVDSSFFATFLANSMFAFALSYYFFITFLGYNGKASTNFLSLYSSFIQMSLTNLLVGWLCHPTNNSSALSAQHGAVFVPHCRRGLALHYLSFASLQLQHLCHELLLLVINNNNNNNKILFFVKQDRSKLHERTV